RDVDVLDHHWIEPRDFFCHEDALLVASVRELQAGNDVADRVDTRNVRRETLVREYEAAVHLDADFFEAVTLGCRTATDCDEQVVGRERGAVFERYRHALLVL